MNCNVTVEVFDNPGDCDEYCGVSTCYETLLAGEVGIEVAGLQFRHVLCHDHILTIQTGIALQDTVGASRHHNHHAPQSTPTVPVEGDRSE